MTLVVGIGNRDRGDDGAGPAVAEQVAALGLPGVRVVRVAEPIRLIELWEGAGDVVVVDALRPGPRSGAPAGAEPVVVIDVDARSLPTWSGCSTHGLGVAEVIELARSLDRLPARLRLIGVSGHRFGPGSTLSPEVAAGVREATELIRNSVSSPA